ncbi:MAG: DUF4355 domain-containing protein [Actinobacteria bacterium]|nr:DUF4355 domain-containing protein [Actinomycetota bacterium]
MHKFQTLFFQANRHPFVHSFADDDKGGGSGSAGGNDGSDGTGNTGDAGKNSGDGTGDTGKKPNDGDGNVGKTTLTQEQVDDVLKKRLARERKTWEAELEEEKKKAQMSEAEKAKAEKEAAEKKANDAIDKANQRLLEAEAKIQASALGVKVERLGFVLKLTDLSEIEVDEDGKIDSAVVKAAVEAVLTAVPELKGEQVAGTRGDNNPAGGNQTPGIDEQIAEAEKKGDHMAAIALKNQKFGITKG